MSDLKTKLDASLGKSIAKICPNKFHDHGSNHCAHFVSHMLDLKFSYNCKQFKGGSKQPGNVRVQEIFAKCPRVGKFRDAPQGEPVLVFVTRTRNVDLASKTMRNVPQKHVGIHLNGDIYHYSNTGNKVVKWTPKKFFDTFEKIYRGTQGLYYGTVPGSDLRLRIDRRGAGVNRGIAFELERRDGNRWFARAINAADDQEFYVGREVLDSRAGYYGIYRKVREYDGPKFKPDDYLDEIDHWAYLLYATGFCESKNFFNVFNTYDRAKFTYGFYQLAAHTPKDNLILMLRAMMRLSGAKDYFPELSMIGGRLHRVDPNGSNTDLERAMDTGRGGSDQLQLLMNYLNPRRKTIEEQEVLQVARLMHWTKNHASVRDLQVTVASDILQEKMSRRYDRWYGLDGQSDLVCTIIADIHHQGRASKKRVKKALRSANPIDAMIDINDSYKNRNRSLRSVVDELQRDGKLGSKTYDAANNEFR